MRFKIYIALSAMLLCTLAASALLRLHLIWIAGEAALAFITLILLYRAVSTPLDAVQKGVYLLKSQDFSSRLKKTGQPEADKVAELFNNLMDTLRTERLKNLEQENFLGKVIASSPMGIAICDFDGRITETNPAWCELMPSEAAKVLGTLDDEETRTLRLSATLIVRLSRLWFMDRGFRRRFYLVEPLTSEIVSAQKHIFNKIVRTIGHETNNTLGSVISVLDTLSGIHADEPQVKEAITGSAQSCDNLVRFVKGYADIVKLPEPKPEITSLHTFIEHLLPVLRGIAGDNIRLVYKPGEKSRMLSFDPMLIERVMINVVKNAAESIASRQNGPERETETDVQKAGISRSAPGKIEISTEGSTISVTDNGAGLSDEAAEKIFTPFYSTKRPDRGLGLMLIADILRGHNADFSLRTDPTTALTTFSFTL